MIPSIQKIIALAVILWLVWVAFKFLDRRKNNLDKKDKNNLNDVEMMKCAECGVWIENNICKNSKCRSNK